MNTQLPAIVPAPQEWQIMKEQARMAVLSGFLPQSIKTPEQAMVIAMKGRELGIPMMTAFSQISVIQGKPTIGAELMLALIYQRIPGVKIEFVETTERVCKILAQRPGEKPEEWIFTIEDAQKLGLTNKDNYKKQPATMLRWRNIAQMARAKFPDALMGASHTPEEMGALVTDEGEVIETQLPIEIDLGPAYNPASPAPALKEQPAKQQENQEQNIAGAGASSPPKKSGNRRITEKQVGRMFGKQKSNGWSHFQLQTLLAHYDYGSVEQIDDWILYDKLCNAIDANPGSKAITFLKALGTEEKIDDPIDDPFDEKVPPISDDDIPF